MTGSGRSLALGDWAADAGLSGAAIHLRRPSGPAPQVMPTQIPRGEISAWIADHDETGHVLRPVIEIFLVPEPAAFGGIAAPL